MFPTLAVAFFGVVVWALATFTIPQPMISEAVLGERTAWWRLVRPLVAGSFAIAFLIGWALQEPNPADEWPSRWLVVLAGMTALVFLRAAWRAAVSLKAVHKVRLPIMTVGLLRCRCVVSEEFAKTVRSEALDAALAHESVHMRRHDPLRIWFAQIVADFQWPIPGAKSRLNAWLLALEVRADDEAVAMGTPALDLAEALLAAARATSCRPSTPVAAVTTGEPAGLAMRVRRLLHERQGLTLTRSGSASALALCSLLALASVWLGFSYGEALLGCLPGIAR